MSDVLVEHPLDFKPLRLRPEILPIDPSGGEELDVKAKRKAISYILLFFLLLESMQIRQDTLVTGADQIEQNALMQDKLNKDNADIHFAILPPNATKDQINQVQEENEEYAAEREDIQNQEITTRQNAEVLMTQASTNVDILQQDASENSGWLKLLQTIFQVIDEITKQK